MAAAHTIKTHITASVMKRMFIAGCKMLEVNKAQVDALNVFPVPDGDTGTNMSLTMVSAVKEITALNSTSMAELAEKLSKGALRGARGNSGVILSQILKGFSNIIAQNDECDAKTFANSDRRARNGGGGNRYRQAQQRHSEIDECRLGKRRRDACQDSGYA